MTNSEAVALSRVHRLPSSLLIAVETTFVFGGSLIDLPPAPEVYNDDSLPRRRGGVIPPMVVPIVRGSGGAVARQSRPSPERNTERVPSPPVVAETDDGQISQPPPGGQTRSWMNVAAGELGVREIGKSNRGTRVDAYHAATDGQIGEAWCSSFVNWTMEQAGYQGTNSAWSRSWLSWGVDAGGPVVGSIVVFARDGTKGHVGFVESVNADGTINVLGGNQGNSVNITTYKTDRVLGYRLPSGYTASRDAPSSRPGTGTIGDLNDTE